MARGITGPFETRKLGIDYACMTGDIEKTAGLTIREPDSVDDARPVHFTKWKPFDLDAVSHRADLAPASEDTDPGMGAAADANAPGTAGPGADPGGGGIKMIRLDLIKMIQAACLVDSFPIV
jgi:hypothetical protein